MERVACKLTERLILGRLIAESEREMYEYSIQIVLEKMIGCAAILGIAVYFHVLPETILFLLFFSGIRRHANGLHLGHFAGCFLASVGIYLLYVSVLHDFLAAHGMLETVILLVALGILLGIGAVNNAQIHWDAQEERYNKRLARCFAVAEVGIIFALKSGRIAPDAVSYMGFGVVLSAVLLVSGWIKEVAK